MHRGRTAHSVDDALVLFIADQEHMLYHIKIGYKGPQRPLIAVLLSSDSVCKQGFNAVDAWTALLANACLVW